MMGVTVPCVEGAEMSRLPWGTGHAHAKTSNVLAAVVPLRP